MTSDDFVHVHFTAPDNHDPNGKPHRWCWTVHAKNAEQQAKDACASWAEKGINVTYEVKP